MNKQHVIFKELFTKLEKLEVYYQEMQTVKKTKSNEQEQIDFILKIFDLYLQACKIGSEIDFKKK
jgi:hypothetical protein